MIQEEINGFEVQCFRMDYDTEKISLWDMSKRWAYSNVEIAHDKNNLVKELIKSKIFLSKDEKIWLLMSGIVLSEWYINRLTDLWLKRGSVMSAHYMINEGINYFFRALFAYNNELEADFKWRIYCIEKFKNKPEMFIERIKQVMEIKEISIDEIERRRKTFMGIWNEFLPRIEVELNMKYDVFKNMV